MLVSVSPTCDKVFSSGTGEREGLFVVPQTGTSSYKQVPSDLPGIKVVSSCLVILLPVVSICFIVPLPSSLASSFFRSPGNPFPHSIYHHSSFPHSTQCGSLASNALECVANSGVIGILWDIRSDFSRHPWIHSLTCASLEENP